MPEEIKATGRELTILAVDDNIVNLKLLSSAMLKEGYRVITAIEGAQARRMADLEQPDLIILDIMMPGEDGFEVIRRLKKNPERPLYR